MDYKSTLNLPQTNFPMKGDGPRREPEIQEFWTSNKIYEKTLEKRKKVNAERFLLHDGPPYLSSGNIHIGTALNKILKDIVVKYKTLRGFYSPYLPGFDCHGLPIESAISKEKKKEGDKILSPLEIRNQCTEFVLKNKKLQEEKFKRLGVLGDWEHAYMTIDPKFEAAQLRLFGEMVDKGYIYRGLKPVFWCATCQTALAEAEVEYVENHKSPSIYVSFKITKLSGVAKKLEKFKDLKIIIWTTTPWTIPGNMAICLNKDFEYAVIESKKFGYLLVAKDLSSQFCQKISEECKILETFLGKELEGSEYKHPLYRRESPVVLGEHVTLETGTGCVHTAPGHGLEDFTVAQKYEIKVISPVDSKGLLTEEAGENLKGLYAHKGGNQKVIELLAQLGALIYQEDYYHSYPHCWRSKTPIMFRATEQWFCSVKDFRDKSLSEIKKVTWVPKIGENRIYAMVESRTDWCISRQRVWGVPIPAFYCNSCNKEHLNKTIIEHVAKFVEEKGTNVWWELEAEKLLPNGYKCSCQNIKFKKETDIMDVWFDSGSTHYSVVDQNSDLFDKNQKGSPSEIYLEGSDQHRGWFQSSLLTSVAINGKAPYKTVLTHGFVLDENGRKMSKSMGNVIDPDKVISEYGSDILRLWVASVDYSSDMRIGQTMLKQLAEVYRNIRNTMRFVLGNLYDYDLNNSETPYENLWNIDKYALHKLEEIKEEITKAFEDYEFYKFYQILQNYCAVDLSAFYFDIVKDRLYVGKKSSRLAVQFVLKEILESLVPILCPVMPHLAEDIYRHLPLKFKKPAESVISLNWPLLNNEFKNNKLNSDFLDLLSVRSSANNKLELLRKEGVIGKSVEAKLIINLDKTNKNHELLLKYKNELPMVFNVSKVELLEAPDYSMEALPADGTKCPRCWKHSTEIGKHPKHSTICLLCAEAVEAMT